MCREDTHEESRRYFSHGCMNAWHAELMLENARTPFRQQSDPQDIVSNSEAMAMSDFVPCFWCHGGTLSRAGLHEMLLTLSTACHLSCQRRPHLRRPHRRRCSSCKTACFPADHSSRLLRDRDPLGTCTFLWRPPLPLCFGAWRTAPIIASCGGSSGTEVPTKECERGRRRFRSPVLREDNRYRYNFVFSALCTS